MSKGPYDDMLDLPHHVSEKHAHMSLLNRAAQFSPFAALTGYDDAVSETARLTQERVELDEQEKLQIGQVLYAILETIDQKPLVQAAFFVPDERKSGGSYQRACGRAVRVDEQEGLLILEDGTQIPFPDLTVLSLAEE